MVNHRRGPWSQHEDAWLVSLVHRNGPHNWVRISQEIQTRSPKQCRERFHQNLKPTLNHEPISPEEGELIERLVQEMGKRWAEIARRLKGRSDNAVKNWWNGGQNRRKRNPDRLDDGAQGSQSVQSSYSYHPLSRSMDRREEHPGQSARYYPEARRSSLNPISHSPQTLQLPPPQSFEPYSGMSASRPHNLELQFTGPFSAHRRWETPMPSPSGYSVVSADGAPSLITDTGSESRSPRGAASPLELTTLAPLVGGRSERKNSSTRFLPQSGFANDDDDHTTIQMPYDPYKRRASVQLPPLQPQSAAPIFREPIYRTEKPQLLTQPAHHHHSLPSGQQPLPTFRSLAEPGRVPDVQSTSPLARQLPSPYNLPPPAKESRSAPASPREGSRDQRMNLSTMLS
ncbi:hypothetical protein BU16DRAFT_449227 [Lophium mytilinum]|uniref:Trichome differentiation protein GL1 n=1 Tax=Lophium mytilinum TaxID=390894 RepID=A0A6A6RG67_9PEZI|nr:hypothetical protein BU16DRAFT_449227 [Lophium mytilinum]